MSTCFADAEVSREPLPVCLTKDSNGLVSLLDFMRLLKPEAIVQTARTLWIIGAVFPPADHEDYKHRVARLRRELEDCFTLCDDLDLPISKMKISGVLATMATPSLATQSILERSCSLVTQTMCEEMSLRKYFEIRQDRTKYFIDTQVPFGEEVSSSFPSTTFDAGEAMRCYALGRSTACVFHLMRVLEIVLAVFARRFSIQSDHTNWHNVIEGIEKAVRNMGSDQNKPSNWKDQQEFFSQAASNFMFIKDAWRNYTAHARAKYTEDEAETLLINVRAFTQKLAAQLHE